MKLLVVDADTVAFRVVCALLSLKDEEENKRWFQCGNVGMHPYTDAEVFKKAEAAAAWMASRKGKGKAKKAQNNEQEPLGEEYASYSDVELALVERR